MSKSKLFHQRTLMSSQVCQVCIRDPKLIEMSELISVFGLKNIPTFSQVQIFRVAEDVNGRIVGYAHCVIEEETAEYKRRAYVSSLVVLPTHQRRGIATKLVIAAHNVMEQMFNPPEYVSVHVRKSNHAAFNLFKESLGYKIDGVEAKYYADDGEDAFVMRKELKGKQMHSGETKGNAEAT